MSKMPSPNTDNVVNTEGCPPVTILLASYNRLSLLKEAVASALEQTYENFEVIIVDDGSGAEVIEWLQQNENKYSVLRVIYGKHQGVAAARALGVEEAAGEFVLILDSDDLLVPHVVQRIIQEFRRHPDTHLVHTQIRELRPNGQSVVQEYPIFTDPSDMLRTTLLKPRLPFKHSGTMFRRDTALKLGSYDCSLPCKVDIDFYLKFLRAGYCPRLVPEPLVVFRMHSNSISRNRWAGLKIWYLLIDRYGPRNPFFRLAIKAARSASEVLKQVYLELSIITKR